jgi:hypothetical protein
MMARSLAVPRAGTPPTKVPGVALAFDVDAMLDVMTTLLPEALR